MNWSYVVYITFLRRHIDDFLTIFFLQFCMTRLSRDLDVSFSPVNDTFLFHFSRPEYDVFFTSFADHSATSLFAILHYQITTCCSRHVLTNQWLVYLHSVHDQISLDYDVNWTSIFDQSMSSLFAFSARPDFTRLWRQLDVNIWPINVQFICKFASPDYDVFLTSFIDYSMTSLIAFSARPDYDVLLTSFSDHVVTSLFAFSARPDYDVFLTSFIDQSAIIYLQFCWTRLLRVFHVILMYDIWRVILASDRKYFAL